MEVNVGVVEKNELSEKETELIHPTEKFVGFSAYIQENQDTPMEEGIEVEKDSTTFSAKPNQTFNDTPIQMATGEDFNKERASYEHHDLSPKETEELEHLIRKYMDVFSTNDDVLGQGKVQVKLRLKVNAVARKHKASKVKHNVLVKIKQVLMDLEKKQVIERSNSPYASPMLLVAKSSGEVRMVVNFSAGINNELEDDHENLPIIDDIIESSRGMKYRSCFDLTQSFFQTGLDEESRPLTSFVSPFGQWQFKVVPMGLKTSPAIQQRLMRTVFGEYLHDFLEVFIDDGLIQSKTWDEHLRHLELVFRKLREYNLKIKRNKCHFALKTIKYCGYVLDEEGIRVEVDRVKAIQDLPEPKNLGELRSFVATCNAYNKFVPHFALIADVLNELMKKGHIWEWKEVHRDAFLKLKADLANAPNLQVPDYNLEFRLTTDASLRGAGAVLTQVLLLNDHIDINKKTEVEQPIAYASWKFSAAESRWSTTERELYAVVLATRKFRPYLFGRELKVQTDHEALAKTRQIKFDPFNRINRWLMELQQYNLNFKYIKGSENPADALSRMFEAIELTSEQFREREEKFVNTVIANKQGGPNTEYLGDPQVQNATKANHEEYAENESVIFQDEDRLKTEQRKDPKLSVMIEYLETGKLPKNFDVARRVILEAERHVIENRTKVLLYLSDLRDSDEIFGGHKLLICIPLSLRAEIFRANHDHPFGGSHMGTTKVYDKIKRQYYWPGIFRMFEDG